MLDSPAPSSARPPVGNLESMSTSKPASSSLGMRVIAVLVLAVAAWILLKVVIGFVTAIATVVVVVLAIVAVIWAIRVL